jgi:metal-responsive CopG/Arc/MetJ family transcriptional regulator
MKMGRKAVKKEVISVKLSQQLLETLDEYCEKVGLTRSEAIRLAIIQLVWGMAGGREGGRERK